MLCPISPALGACRGCLRQGIGMLSVPTAVQQRCQLLQQGALPAIDPAPGVTSLHRRPGPDSHQQDTSDNKVAYVTWFQRSLLLIC